MQFSLNVCGPLYWSGPHSVVQLLNCFNGQCQLGLQQELLPPISLMGGGIMTGTIIVTMLMLMMLIVRLK